MSISAAPSRLISQVSNKQKSYNYLAQQISSMRRVLSSKDDVAASSISNRMQNLERGLERCVLNVEQGSALLGTAASYLDQINGILQSMADVAIQANSAVNSATETMKLNNQFATLKATLDQTALSAQFNKKQLFNGTVTTTVTNATAAAFAIANMTMTVNPNLPDTTYQVTYNGVGGAQDMTITDLETGQSQTVKMQKANGIAETLHFFDLGIQVDVTNLFGKGAAIANAANASAYADIPLESIKILETTGKVAATLASNNQIVFVSTAGANPLSVQMMLDGGEEGFFVGHADFRTIGIKTVTLERVAMNGRKDSITLQFQLNAGVANNAGVNSTITLNDLRNCFTTYRNGTQEQSLSFQTGVASTANSTVDVTLASLTVASLGLTNSDLIADKDAAYNAVQFALDRVSNVQATVGNGIQALDIRQQSLKEEIAKLNEAIDSLVGLDLTKAYSDFAAEGTTLQACFQILAKVNDSLKNVLALAQ